MIKLQSVSKKYPIVKQGEKKIQEQFEDFWALKDITLEVERGKILGIIGRNGAGKTTLLNIIAGVLSPTHGEIKINGKIIGLFNLGIGFHDELTGKENIFLNGAILGASREELETKLNSIIEFSELGDFINMPLGSYSQGMRLRLGFSIIANLDFDILVLDEILAVGDALFQSKCYERLMDFKRSGKTLVITTQSMDLIERLCDTAALVDHGKLLFHGETAKGINRYHALLNTEKFFVGPVKENIVLVKNTKKWTDDISNWGKEFGTKEVIIKKVKFINRFGWKCSKIKTGEPLRIKVHFTAKNNIKEPHFGVAIFRNDGVYCYGPNTKFENYYIPELKTGTGYFILNYHKLFLAPSEYRISIAIWDKDEIVAFVYHHGCYKLIINGNHDAKKQLTTMPFFFFPRVFMIKNITYPDLSTLKDQWGQKIDINEFKIDSAKLMDSRGKEKDVFTTNEPAKFLVNFSKLACSKDYSLWVGLYREDGIYCQGITRPFTKNTSYAVLFPKLSLLPGGYVFSIGVWENRLNRFIMCHHAVYPFRIVFIRKDHGTIYLEHKWSWKLP